MLLRVDLVLCLTGAGSRLVAWFVGRLRALSSRPQVLFVLGRVRGPVNTVAIRRPVRAFKVTIKHAGCAPFIVTTFALFVVRRRADGRRLDVEGAALGVVGGGGTAVHESAHRRRHVLGAGRRCHAVRRAVLRRRRREREDVVRLAGGGTRRLRFVGIAAAERHPARVAEGLRAVRQPRVEGGVEVRPAHLAGGHPRR